MCLRPHPALPGATPHRRDESRDGRFSHTVKMIFYWRAADHRGCCGHAAPGGSFSWIASAAAMLGTHGPAVARSTG